MSGADEPRVDVARLLDRVRAESRRRRGQADVVDRPLDLSPVEAMLEQAAARTAVRTALPRRLDRFPFNRVRPLERAILKLYEWLTHEQRTAIAHLTDAMRELVDGVRRIEERIDGLPAEGREIEALKARVRELESALALRGREGAVPAEAPAPPLDAARPGRSSAAPGWLLPPAR